MRRNMVLATTIVFSAMLFSSLSVALAYSPGTTYTWDSSVPNYSASATIHEDTINTYWLSMSDFLGRSASEPSAADWGDSGTSVNWDDSYVIGVGDGNTNGDNLDGLWSQIFDSGGWWDVGFATDKVAVFTSQDHGPYLGEGLEYRVFGSNTLWDDMSLSPQATLTDVYLDGWRPHVGSEDANGNGWCSDDIAGVFQLNGHYRYIKLVPWGGGTYTEPEIDAVAALHICIEIDIKPFSCPNSINMKNKGVIPVAVFGTEWFDVTEIDPSTVRFGPTGTEAEVHMLPNGKFHYGFEDVNWDGYLDAVFHFPTQDTGFGLGDTVGILRGQTYSGMPFMGSDSVRILNPP